MNWVKLAQATWSENKQSEEVVVENIAETTTGVDSVQKWTSDSFTLWERDVSILVKNASTERQENTVFKVNDTHYRWIYVIQDFLSVGKDGINLEFGNMKCNYKANVKIDPAVYIKNVIISYGYNNRWDCIHKVSPEEMQRLVSITTTQVVKTEQTIQLNDLSILHIISYAAFWVFVAIALWIIYIKKKKVLIYNKNV